MSVSIFQCAACFELLYEPISLPCAEIVCKRCFRLPKPLSGACDKNTKECSAVQSIGAYSCPSKNCSKTHRYRKEQIMSSLQKILQKLFPLQQKALCYAKSGEELLMQLREEESKEKNLFKLDEILQSHFNLAINTCSSLQLPYILRSKVLAEMGQFDSARQNSRTANELNPVNKRGIVSEKLVGWLQMMQQSKKCVFSDMRDQLRQACKVICPSNGPESKFNLESTIKDTISNISLDDLECQLCLENYHNPIATPCGHVFCKLCLLKSLDHSRLCPLCRSVLPTIGYFIHRKPINVFNVLLQYFNIPVVDQEFEFKPEWIPIYHSPLMFPLATGQFHISEPQHRVLVKRCIETTKVFGVMLPNCGSNLIQYGTLCQITSFQPLLSCDIAQTIDGNLPRYVVNVTATSRFKIENTRISNGGYHEALSTRIEDFELEDFDWVPTKLESLVKKARDFCDIILGSLPPSARLYFDRKNGKMPLDPAELSFWLGEMLPLNPYTLYRLLPIQSVEERLAILCQWLEEASKHSCFSQVPNSNQSG